MSRAGPSCIPVYAARVKAGESIVIKYIHSVERTPWYHYYLVTPNNRLRLVAMRFKSFGAGVPDEAPQAQLKDGWVEYSGFDQEYASLLWNVQSQLSHGFELHGRELYFGDLVPDQSNVIIKVAYRPLLFYFLTHYHRGGYKT